MASESHKEPDGKSSGAVSGIPSDGLAHGITIAGSIVLFLWLGDLLDGRLGTSPLFALLGLSFGAGASFYRMYVHLVLIPREREEARQKERAE